MNGPTVEFKVRFAERRQGRKAAKAPAARVPRIAKLMALAIHLDGLLREGKVKDQAELARLGHVSRARVTQIMNLLNLAPDIQEGLLHLQQPILRTDIPNVGGLQRLAAIESWHRQREDAQGVMGVRSPPCFFVSARSEFR